MGFFCAFYASICIRTFEKARHRRLLHCISIFNHQEKDPLIREQISKHPAVNKQVHEVCTR